MLTLLAVITSLAWPASWLEPRPSPYKGLRVALTAPGARVLAERSSPLGLLTVVESPLVPFRHAPGLSLGNTIEPPPQLGAFTDADALSVITRFTGDRGALGYLDQQTMALPYHVLDRPRTLILGAGGGADVLRALYHRAPRIDAVELNPDLIALVRGEFARFAGGIYDRTDVTVHSAEARSFVQASERSWDLIQVALLDSFTAAAAGVQALGETPLYTVEALRSYYAHLGPGGILAVTRWLRSPPSDPIKLFATAIVALEQAGVSSPGDRLAMIHDWNTATLLVKEAPFDPAEIARMRAFAEARSFDVAWFSGIREAEANRFNRQEEPSLYRAATELLGPERERFLRIYKFHIEPATDDRPYFFRFFKFELLPELFALRAQGGLAQADTGYLVVLAALVQAGFASLVLILLPLAALRTGAPRAEPAQARPAVAARWRVAVYFLALGFGFMFIEISFIHRFTTFLGHPLAAIAVVLAAFLIFAGLGSGIAGEIEERRRAAVAIAVGGIILFAGTYLVVLPVWLPELIAWPFPAKAAVALLLIAPLGVAMGMPFPLGLARVAARTPGLVPWAWAINGCASVVGAVLASLLAMHVGFTVVVCLALALYAMAVLAFEAGSPRPAAIESGPETRAGVEAPAHRVGEARPPALDQSPEATARPAAVSGIPASGAPMA
jgi:spermidine synthase